MSLSNRLRGLCPPLLLRHLRRISPGTIRYAGPYPSWQSAADDAIGYDDLGIVDRVAHATREVVAGRAAFERDSVLLDECQPPFHLVAPMLRVAMERGGRLSVLDYGGSLGSTYRWCRPHIGEIPLQWNVVEQRQFVAVGKSEFETEELRFYNSTAEIRGGIDAVLFSSVLQYLEDPCQAIRSADFDGVEVLILDRTPFCGGAVDHVCVQHVPTKIYRASYPLWIFSYAKMLERLSPRWRLVGEFVCPEDVAITSGGMSFEFKGLILRKKHVD